MILGCMVRLCPHDITAIGHLGLGTHAKPYPDSIPKFKEELTSCRASNASAVHLKGSGAKLLVISLACSGEAHSAAIDFVKMVV